jgi:hypothetical protein
MHARRLSTFKTFGILLGSVLCVSASALHAQAVTIVQTASRFAGTGIAGFGGDFGSSTSLSLNMPSYVVLDTAGNEYLSDTGNNCVRRIDTSGNVTTLAGLAISGQGDTCSTGSNPTPTAAQGLLRRLRTQLHPPSQQWHQWRRLADHRRWHMFDAYHRQQHTEPQRSRHRHFQQPLCRPSGH